MKYFELLIPKLKIEQADVWQGFLGELSVVQIIISTKDYKKINKRNSQKWTMINFFCSLEGEI